MSSATANFPTCRSSSAIRFASALDGLPFGLKRDGMFSRSCCFQVESCSSLMLWHLHSSACEVSLWGASSTTFAFKLGGEGSSFAFCYRRPLSSVIVSVPQSWFRGWPEFPMSVQSPIGSQKTCQRDEQKAKCGALQCLSMIKHSEFILWCIRNVCLICLAHISDYIFSDFLKGRISKFHKLPLIQSILKVAETEAKQNGCSQVDYLVRRCLKPLSATCLKIPEMQV